jgi:hypothetical protein
VGRALAAPVEQPQLWLLGTLSFVLRGGIIVLLAPIVVLPTQVEVRLMLGGNLGSNGLTPAFWTSVSVATVISTGLVLVLLYALARIEMGAFERLASDPEVAADTGLAHDLLAPQGATDRGARMRDLFVVESLTLIALLLAAVPLAAAIGQTTLDEILLPSSAASIFDRVLGHLGAPLAIVAVALPIIDALSAGVVRQLLVGRSVGSALAASFGAIIRRPLAWVATVALAWSSLVVVVIGVEWALSIAWQATRASFLATTSVSDMLNEVAPLLVAAMLTGVFVCGLALCGYVAAFRNALWSVTGLRH